MEKSIEREFAIKFNKIIEKSIFPTEKEELLDALKTLKISRSELIVYFIEMLDNNTVVHNGENQVNLENLPKAKFLEKIIPLLETGDVKCFSAVTRLSELLNTILTIYQQQLNSIDESELQSHLKSLESQKKLIRQRFNYDEKQMIKPIIVEEDFKGQHSFSLKKGKLISSKSNLILNELRSKGFIENTTSSENFISLFSGSPILKENRINWTSTSMNLKLFIMNIKPKLLVKEYAYLTALRCFTLNGKNISSAYNLEHSSGSKKAEKTIISIISIF